MHKYISMKFGLLVWSLLSVTGETVKAAPVILAYRKLLISPVRVSSGPLNNGPDNKVKIHPHVSLRCAQN